ncbi:MAG: divergent polysaccharide deacetylase family protein [Arcobacteraceae bacterium]|nr:divergent polysaccharide deacetylase family protein [Arcobacteraceae bacterium]
MPKRKRQTKKRTLKKSPLFIINIIIVICLVVILGLSINLFYQDKVLEDIPTIKKPLVDKKQEEKLLQEQQAKYFEEKTQAMEIEYVKEDIDIIKEKDVLEKEESVFHFTQEDDEALKKIDEIKTKIIELEQTIISKPKPKPVIKEIIKQLPKLAIIIDDVTTKYQVQKISSISYPITMSFLPPTSRHKNSAKIAQNTDIYMIHLPLEAGISNFEETNTLHIADDIDIIDNRMQKLKKLYPKAKYLNNHTGSKFTSNSKAMDKLLKVLKKYGYIFLDSRTTSKTVAKKYAKKHDVRYLSRNIFLDNKRDKSYIQKQLRKAVRIAKKDGMAIAIGHPHSITLKTLSQSKHLLQGLDIVFIDKL